jgi:uncharacterized damage-inducible protein DinB
MDAATLTHLFSFNQRALKLNLEGVSHEDSVRHPGPNGNSINWIVGHILANRQDVLEMAGQPRFWPEEEARRYERGSEPLAPSDARPLNELLVDLERSQEALAMGFEQLTPEALAAPQGKSTLERQLLFLHFHEAYHVGQTGIVRRLIGKPGAIR